MRSAALNFADRSDELSRAMAQHLHDELPELRDEDSDLLELTRTSCQSNINEGYRLLHAGRSPSELAFTTEAREYVLAYVERGIALPALLRSYRLAHAWIWQQWAELLKSLIHEQEQLSEAIEFSSQWIFEYIDLVSAALVEEFANEQSLRLRSADQLTAATVRELIAGAELDVDVASRRLGYALRRRHVAIRLKADEETRGQLEPTLRTIAAMLGAGDPLILRSGALTLTAWCGFDTLPDPELFDQLEGHLPRSGPMVSIATGDRPGVAGFLTARADAIEAERIAELIGAGRPLVTTYQQIELVSLLSADESRARRFVERQLGELAANDEGTARLRETLLAFLQERGSSGRAAKALFVHQNTVTYRVHRAEEILGRPIAEHHAELLCALLLAVVIGYGNGRPSQPS